MSVMSMKNYKKILLGAFICLLPVLLAACGHNKVGQEGKIAEPGFVSGEINPEADFVEGEGVAKVFYYDESLDLDDNGQIICSTAGLVPVEKTMNAGQTGLPAVEEVIGLLLHDPIPAESVEAGLTSEFPLPGFTLDSLSLEDGVLSLNFIDFENASSGGSCRVGIMRAQIEATARQFPGISEVRILPEEILQP